MALRIAAIVTAWNRPNDVLDALNSVAAQHRAADRLIVVDDCSTDETPRAIQQWMERAATTLDMHFAQPSANSGPAAARNFGADHAGDCDVLTYLDDDDLWPADYLHRVERAFEEHDDAVAAVADRTDVNLRTGRKKLQALAGLVDNPAEWLIDRGLPGIPNTSYRRRDFDAVGRFDPSDRFAEDYPLMLRLTLRGRWLHLPGQPVTVRRLTSDSEDKTPRLSKKHAVRRRRIAEMLEQFLLHEGGRDAVPDRVWRRRLGRMWYSAGRQLLRLKQPDEAAQCFQRANEIDPRNLRAWWRRLHVGPRRVSQPH